MARLVHITIRGDDRCTARDEDKDACGGSNMTKAECKNAGCCWAFGADPGIPRCFQKSVFTRATAEDCAAPSDERTECGMTGVTQGDCEDLGCCYKPSLDGTPWCFHRLQRAEQPHNEE